ncbi:MAG: hypothetical protein ACPGTP_01405 [Bacteroidia bacterium]
MKSSTFSTVVGVVLTFLVAFFLASNLTSYQNPSQINELRETLLTDFENRMDDMQELEGAAELQERYVVSIEKSLTEGNYKRASMYRFIGFIVVLFGVFVLRKKKSIGLHLFLAGMLFVVITGFYSYGMGIVGWALNIGYIIFTTVVGLFYYIRRGELI